MRSLIVTIGSLLLIGASDNKPSHNTATEVEDNSIVSCKLGAKSASELYNAVSSSALFLKVPTKVSGVELYQIRQGATRWYFAISSDAAYPAAFCKRFDNIEMRGLAKLSSLKCSGNKNACRELQDRLDFPE